MKRLDLDENKIRALYLDEKKTMKEIANIFGVSKNTIFRRLKQKRAMRRENSPLNLSKIKDLYVGQKKSAPEIAKIFNVSPHPIYSRLEEAGIKRRKKKSILDNDKIRKLYVNEMKSTTKIAKIMGVSCQTIIRRLKDMGIKIRGKKLNLNIKKIKDLYINKKKSLREIAEIFRVSDITILNKLKKMNIRRRNTSEAKKGKYLFDKHPNWMGGKSFEPYGTKFNKELKEQIRQRDNYTCQECGKTQEELKELLSVHHIDYNKQHNLPLNLISLCRKCHLKTNYNRKHWTNYFKMKMFMKTLFDPRNILIFNKNKQLIGVNMIK